MTSRTSLGGIAPSLPLVHRVGWRQGVENVLHADIATWHLTARRNTRSWDGARGTGLRGPALRFCAACAHVHVRTRSWQPVRFFFQSIKLQGVRRGPHVAAPTSERGRAPWPLLRTGACTPTLERNAGPRRSCSHLRLPPYPCDRQPHSCCREPHAHPSPTPSAAQRQWSPTHRCNVYWGLAWRYMQHHVDQCQPVAMTPCSNRPWAQHVYIIATATECPWVT